ncbi:MAG: hypothetical protein QOJ37_187 [Pseudonocardiales bacterium]|jgi:hypothetical protein|nr:hypothetical protein [Pseudonocardiales bacterium]
MRLPIGDVLGFATGATTPESLDSSKVRSNTIRRAQEVGLVRVTRYGKTAGYVASPELIDGLSEQARKLVALVDELHAARPLLVAATRLGIRPEDALAVLMPPTREDLDVAALAELVAAAAEDLEAAPRRHPQRVQHHRRHDSVSFPRVRLLPEALADINGIEDVSGSSARSAVAVFGHRSPHRTICIDNARCT